MRRSPHPRLPTRLRLLAVARRAAPLLACAAAAASCGRAGAGLRAGADEPPASLDAYVRWQGDVPLEENREVVNVLVRMNLDPRGGFLVADEQEDQVRRYDAAGRLLAHFGRKGYGPREFTYLHRALRLRSGGILAVDDNYRIAVFDSTGAAVSRTFRTDVSPLHAARVVNDSLLLLGGQVRDRRAAPPGTRLHLWNLRTGTPVRHFFTPAVRGRAHVIAAATAGFVAADVRGDTVAAAFALTDTLYFFGLDGRRLGAVPIPFRHFRRLSENRPVPSQLAGLTAARAWVGSFSMISDVFWLRDGTFLVQYQDRVGSEPRWRLLRMRRDGTPLFEAVGTPYLMQVDPATGVLYFQKPGSAVPNVLSLAVLTH